MEQCFLKNYIKNWRKTEMGINKMRTKVLALCISAALSFNTVGLTVNPANAQAGQVNNGT